MKQRTIYFLAVFLISAQVLIIYPSITWAQNQFNFDTPLIKAISLLGITLSILLLLSYVLSLITPAVIRKTLLPVTLVLTVVIFIQQNILVGDYGVIDGNNINFDKSGYLPYIDTAIWVTGLLFSLLFGQRIIKQASLILMFSGLASIAVLIASLSAYDFKINQTTYTITENNKFSFSDQKNVLVFVLDGFQSDLFWDFINQEPQIKNSFPGFTFYPNTSAVFAKTYPTIPLLLTGKVYKKEQAILKFIENSYKDSLLTKLIDKGWDVGLYPQLKSLVSANSSTMSNINSNSNVSDKLDDYLRSVDLSLFRTLPHYSKKSVYNDGHFIVQNKLMPYIDSLPAFKRNTKQAFKLPNLKRHMGLNFLENLKLNLNTQLNAPAFRFYHLLMPHSPFLLDQDLSPIEHVNDFTHYQNYAYASIKLMALYLEEIKKAGLYDKSAIIIVADHGGGEYTDKSYDPKTQKFSSNPKYGHQIASGKPLLLIKNFSQNHDLKLSKMPVSLIDIMPTVAGFTQIDTHEVGTDIHSNLSLNSRERTYFYYNFTGFDSKYLEDFQIFKIQGDVYDNNSWKPNGKLRSVESMAQNQLSEYHFNDVIRFGTDIKFDADISNQYISDKYKLKHSSVESKNQQIILTIPLEKPVVAKNHYFIEATMSAQSANTNIEFEIEGIKTHPYILSNKEQTLKIPFNSHRSTSNTLKLKIISNHKNNDNKFYLSRLVVSKTKIFSPIKSQNGFMIDFSSDVDKYHANGFWPSNSWGAWTKSPQSSLLFKAPQNMCQHKLLKINILKFANGVDPKSLKVYLNNNLLFLADITENPTNQDFVYECLPHWVNEDSLVEIRFKTDKTVSPATISDSKDVRPLGFGIRSIEF